ncbi:hypothetical protein HG531_002246 [Fusarium graminearum]|nr:hypothetical protein HG531_002246 [Fusarium graminearum]
MEPRANVWGTASSDSFLLFARGCAFGGAFRVCFFLAAAVTFAGFAREVAASSDLQVVARIFVTAWQDETFFLVPHPIPQLDKALGTSPMLQLCNRPHVRFLNYAMIERQVTIRPVELLKLLVTQQHLGEFRHWGEIIEFRVTLGLGRLCFAADF